MHKIICTGNPNDRGVAMAMKKLFPETTFISRRTGYDLSTIAGMEKFKEALVNHNVLINNAEVLPGIQQQVLEIARGVWNTGHIFNMGSICEFERWQHIDPQCNLEKLKLRQTGLEMISTDLKVTHVISGGCQSLDSHSDNKMDPIYVAKVIKFALEFEKHIPVISVSEF